MMEKIGLIAGTLFADKKPFGNLKKKIVKSEFGPAIVYIGERLIYLHRHRSPFGAYTLPHEINHCANIAALKSLGVREIIAAASTGSLKRNIPPSSIVIPDDFIALYPLPTSIKKTFHHPTPHFDQEVRKKLIAATIASKNSFFDNGVYLQTFGPRFETKAEIAMMSHFADVVGMTVASEASVCAEMDLAYAAISSVDNYANGVGDAPLRLQEIEDNASINAERIIEIIKIYGGIS